MPPETRTVILSVAVPRSVVASLKDAAREDARSVSAVVTELVRDWLELRRKRR